MKKTICFLCILALTAGKCMGQNAQPIIRTNQSTITFFEKENPQKRNWSINPQARPDILETSASEVTFFSEKDTLTFKIEKDSIYDFIVLRQKQDTAYTQVRWISENPLENPQKWMQKISPSGLLCKKQAELDIDALIYTIGEVHPNMFHNISQGEFFTQVNRIKESLPDSISPINLYKKLTSLVVNLGDGHTGLLMPYNNQTQVLPMQVNVDVNSLIMTVKSSYDEIIPQGATILSINGKSYKTILDEMKTYINGERDFFRIQRLNNSFPEMCHLIYNAEKYEIEYCINKGEKKIATLRPASIKETKRHLLPKGKKESRKEAYSFTLMKEKKCAIMDFRSFEKTDKMKEFADSMFTTLRENDIKHLIIDIRNNGGGNSKVGDELFKYISPVPFNQFGNTVIRITPTTKRIAQYPINMAPGWYFHNAPEMIQPLTVEEGHFDGKVYLLTSNYTFSSASVFSWAFKHFNMGTVIGEETGGMNVHFGDILYYKLPVSGITCYISYKRFWNYGANEQDIHGTLPDHPVPQAEALEKALKLIKKSK